MPGPLAASSPGRDGVPGAPGHVLVLLARRSAETVVLTAWGLLGLGVLLTVCTALFVAAEFSLISLDRPMVERAVAAGDRRAVTVLSAVRSLSTQLSGAQVGITLTTLIVGYLVEPSLAALLTPPLEAAGLSAVAAPAFAVALGLVIATVFSMIVGELLPQNLGISVPLATAKVVAGPQQAFTRIMGPLITLLNGSANRVLNALGIEPVEELSSARTPEELAALVRRSAEAGTLDENTAQLLTRSLGFTGRTAADVMTPRVRMHALAQDATAADVVKLTRRTGLSRFPVVGEGADDVLGVVHLKSAIAVPRDQREATAVTAMMSEALRVPETVRLGSLMSTLRQSGLQLAVVADEYGGTAGVVTLEDVVEEIVGEVSDEHDRSRPGIVRRRDGSYSLPGLMRPDEIRNRIDLEVPDGPAYETVGGYVMSVLGRVPAVGDEVLLPGAVLRVERMDGRRVDRLGARPAPADPPDAGNGVPGTRAGAADGGRAHGAPGSGPRGNGPRGGGSRRNGSRGREARVHRPPVADSRADARADSRADARADARADSRADARADARADSRADARPDEARPGVDR